MYIEIEKAGSYPGLGIVVKDRTVNTADKGQNPDVIKALMRVETPNQRRRLSIPSGQRQTKQVRFE